MKTESVVAFLFILALWGTTAWNPYAGAIVVTVFFYMIIRQG